MSIINATFVIQAGNFVLAFLLIKYFFFKSVYGEIQAEDDFQKSLVTTVQEHQVLVGNKERELVEHWQAVRTYFVQHTPLLKHEPLFGQKKPMIEFPHFDPLAIEGAIKRLEHELGEKVNHVRK
jgi:hypothetical protein